MAFFGSVLLEASPVLAGGEVAGPSAPIEVEPKTGIFSTSLAAGGCLRLAVTGRSAEPAEALTAANLLTRWVDQGAACLPRLADDFALAVVNAREATLSLALTPLSELELFYHRRTDGTVRFSTDLPTLLAGAAPELDWRMLGEAFRMGAFFDHAETLYAGVRQVQPGTVVRFVPDTVTVTRFWDLPEPVAHYPPGQAADELRHALEKAVAARLSLVDGAKGSLLSAGRDSSAVTAVAARLLGEQGQSLDAWTSASVLGAENAPAHMLDEAPVAARTAARFANIRHHVLRPAPFDLCERLDRIHRRVAVPIAQPLAVAWCEQLWDAAAAQGNRLLLGGDFGNYALSAGGLAWLEDVRRESGVLRWGTSAAGIAFEAPGGLKLLAGALLGHRWRSRASAGPRPLEAFLQAPIRNDWRLSQDQPPRSQTYRQWLRQGIRVSLNPCDIVRIDRDLELCDPTRDRALVELVHKLPASLLASPDDRRRIFERAFGDLLPKEVLRPRKRGRQNFDWHISYPPQLLREGLRRYAAAPLVRQTLDVPALERALDEWPRNRTLSGLQFERFVWGVLPAISLASFLYTRET